MNTATSRRIATHERWQAALQRALAEGLQVRQLAGSGTWIATSGTDAAAAYLVSANGCECQAGEFGDPVCKHWAMLWHALGLLDLEPDASSVVEPEMVTTCPACGGTGFHATCRGHWIAGGYVVHCPCSACDGAGTVGGDVLLDVSVA